MEKPLEKIVDGYSNTAIFRTIAFIGDSLSSGEFEVSDKDGNMGYYDMFEYSWGQFIARKNGAFAYNFSRGGMTAKEYIESFAEERNFWDKDKACQAYVIALGVNDLLNTNTELGTVEDIDVENYKNNKDNFAGNYARIISRYKEINPYAKFFLVGFPKSDEEKNNIAAERLNKLLTDFTKVFDNTYLINLYEYGVCYDNDFKSRYFLNGHMDPMGYNYTAQIIDSYIDYIIRNNPDDFKYVGFDSLKIK